MLPALRVARPAAPFCKQHQIPTTLSLALEEVAECKSEINGQAA